MQDTAETEKIFISDLIEEIKIFLTDCFECKITHDSQSITFNFYNGQKFILKAEEF